MQQLLSLLPEPEAILDGIPCYSPALAVENTYFDNGTLEMMARAEQHSWWYKSRNQLIGYLVATYSKRPDTLFLEFGCGNGSVIGYLRQRFPGFALGGIELLLEGLKVIRQRFPGIETVQMDVFHLPAQEICDAAGMFDVLEHLDDDEAAMRSVYAALRPGGHFYLSVPQHPWLYSRFDRKVGHRSRYTRREMLDKLQRNGFQVVRVTGSNFFLLPLLFVKRQLDRYLVNPNQKVDIARLMHTGSVSNFLFGAIMRLEMALIRLGISLPAGGSLVVVARKPN